MAFVLRLSQGGSTLVDFTDGVAYATLDFKQGTQIDAQERVHSTITFDVLGSDADHTLLNLSTLYQVLLMARDNDRRAGRGDSYNPIWLQRQVPNVSNLGQSELFADDQCIKNLDQLLQTPILGAVLENVQLELWHRRYFDATAPVTLYSGSAQFNNADPIQITGILGDVPVPLYIRSRTSGGGHDRMIVALRAPVTGDVSHWTCRYEAEAYGSRGSGVADLTDASFSPGSGVSGQRWTPPGTTQQLLVALDMSTNASDQVGWYRVLVACRDNNATANVALQAKAAIYAGGVFNYGEWGADPQYVSLVGVRTLVDCGIVKNPAFDAYGIMPSGNPSIHIYGQALAAVSNFDVDCAYLMPVYQAPEGGGYAYATYPIVLGTGASPDAVIDSNDRVPAAYMSGSSGELRIPARLLTHRAVKAFPNLEQRLVILIVTASSGQHIWNDNLTVTIQYTPRWAIGQGAAGSGILLASDADYVLWE